MITVKRLSEATFEEAIYISNEGFKGYFSDMTMTLDRYLGRIVGEGLSPELSVIAYVDNKPAGFVLNGFRTVNGTKISWNGGTGVAPEFRRHGVGKRLIEECLNIYREQGVDVAFLEAIGINDKAIALYEKMGYQTTERVTFVQHNGPIQPELFHTAHGYTIEKTLPVAVANLPFYQGMAAWQTQWQSIQNGQAVLLKNQQGETVGYALYKHTFDENGKITSMALYQCVVNGDEDKATRVKALLEQVYAPCEVDCRRYTVNIPVSSEPLIQILTEAGFTTLSEQVFMKRNMKE